jgi:type IV fimbrial biogenesis protein FimT
MDKKAANRGFTLIEILVVVSIMAVLLALGVPSMREAIERNTVSGHINTFIGGLRYARSEAIRAGVPVVMCQSTNAETSAPTCAGAGASWADGWLIFVNRDLDAGNIYSSAGGDTLLKVQGPLSGSGNVTQTSGAANTKFVFRSTGLLTTGVSSFTFDSTSLDPRQKRLICVSMQGRARILATATEACTGTDV